MSVRADSYFGFKARKPPNNVAPVHEVVWREIEEVHTKWRTYQGSRYRDAIYPFLASVFELVTLWQEDGALKKKGRAAIYARGVGGIDIPKRIDAFSAIIIAAAYPWRVHPRTVSKWSRALQYALKRKPAGRPLGKFIMGKGGINACATRYSKYLRRRRDS